MKCSLVYLVAQLCLTLCDPVDCSLPGSSVHGLLQARILEWVAISFSRGPSQLRDWTHVFCIVGRRFFFLTTEPSGKSKHSLDISSFLKRSFLEGSFPFYCFPLFLCIIQLGTFSYLSLLFFGTLHSVGYIFPILLCLSLLFFSQVFVRASQMIILPSCISFSLWWFWSLPPVQRYKPLSIVLQALCLPDLIPWICCYPNYSLLKDPALEFLRYIVYICNLLCSNSLSLNSSLAFHRFAFLFFCLHFELNTLFSKFFSFV